MPRVSDQYIQLRRRKIIDAAWGCFSVNGFHATSIDDVIEASGTSPGVVYRWFQGKDELVSAVVSEALQGVVDTVTELRSAEPHPTLSEAVSRVLSAVLAATTRNGSEISSLPLQAWTEALRDDEINELVTAPYRSMLEGFAELMAKLQDRGDIRPEIAPLDLARPVFSLIPGFLVQHLLINPVDPQTYAEAIRVLLAENR